MPSKTYLPDDARFDIAALNFLQGDPGRNLREAIARLSQPGHPTVAEIARLRKEFPAYAVRVALTLAALQTKGKAKFPELRYAWSPPEALEQATSSRVARHKAARFAEAMAKGPRPVYDLCCGIGGDALALADIAPVTAVDLSAVRVACLRYNLAECSPAPRFTIETRVADVESMIPILPQNALVHIDPARRSAGKRSPEYADMQPGPEILEALLRRAAGVAIKLSPAVDFDALPPGHLELYSENGTVVQAVLWTGEYFARSPDTRSATLLSDRQAEAFRFSAIPAQPRLTPLPFEIGSRPGNPRNISTNSTGHSRLAGLAAPFLNAYALSPLTTDGGYATSTPLVQAPAGLTAFQVIAVHPYSERRIAAELAALPPTPKGGAIEVKTRGRLPGIDTDHLQVTWSRAARGPWTVLIFRHGKEVYAAIAQRL